MRYILAFLLPPLAVLLCGKPFTAVLNLLFTLLFWVPGIVHALIVVSSHKGDQRAARQIRAMEKQTAAIQSQTRAQLKQAQEIASAQMRTMVESSAAIAASNMAAASQAPRQLPAEKPVEPPAETPTIETSYPVGRDGEVIGEYTWSEIQRYLSEGSLLPTDYYHDGSDWVPLG